MKRHKRLCKSAALTALMLSLSALLLSGCATFASPPTASQNQVIGSVRISLTVCASQPGALPDGACADQGNSASSPFTGGYASSGTSQLFLGFRVPSGAGAPQSFSSSAAGGGSTELQFTKSAGYTSELQRLDPAPAGKQWVGYTSQYVDYDASSGDQRFSANVDFALPEHADGSPFAGPFTYQAVVGGRQYGDDPAQPIDCQDSLTGGWGGPGMATQGICVDDPAPEDLDTDSSLDTRDAGIMPGSAVSVVAGNTASVPFTFAYAGTEAPAASFAFEAKTTVSGAAATPSVATLAPTADSSRPVGVSVSVPESTAPGNYSVTLTARLSNGESRSGTAVLVVSASPDDSPDASPAAALPANTSLPYVSGNRRQGRILSTSRGVWRNGSTSISYQWQRCKRSAGTCSAISRATKRYYRLAAADVGSKVRVQVTSTNDDGSASATSARVGPIRARVASSPEIREAMSIVLVPRGKAARIPALLKNRGYSFSFNSPAAGRLTLSWYLKSGKTVGNDKQVLVARTKASFSRATTVKIKIVLNAQGRKLLASSEQVALVGTGTFSQTGKPRAIVVTKRLTLRR